MTGARWPMALLALAACAPAHARRIPAPLPASPAGIDRSILAREVDVERELAARACACTDLACLDDVDADHRTYLRTVTLKNWITGVEPRPDDLRSLRDAAILRRMACTQHLGAVSFAWVVTDVRDATAVRDAACGCQDSSCTHRVKEAVDRFRAAQIMLAPEGSPERADWDRLGVETDACLNEGLAHDALIELLEIRAEACGCDDRACADGVVERYDRWNERATTLSPTAEVTAELVNGYAAEIAGCVQDVRR